MVSLAKKIIELRRSRGLTQKTLADKAGITRQNLSMIEIGRNKNPSTSIVMKLAEALNVTAEELFIAEGLMPVVASGLRDETPEEILERLRVVQPVSVPVYKSFSSTGRIKETAGEFVYISREKAEKRDIEAIIYNGPPMTHQVLKGDVLVVDIGMKPQEGDILLCVLNEGMAVGRMEIVEGERYIAAGGKRIKLSSCRDSAVVIESITRFK